MRLATIVGSLVLAGSAPSATAVESGHRQASTDSPDAPDTNERLTECKPSDYFPGGKVPPVFYQNTDSPEWHRYEACVKAEAERDGAVPRLASPASFPKVGTCFTTRVHWVGSRFGDNPRDISGSAISFDNGIYLVGYETVRGVVHSRVGDRVRICVHDLPEDCPADDLRGIGYRTSNLRTGERWIMGNSHHICRGA